MGHCMGLLPPSHTAVLKLEVGRFWHRRGYSFAQLGPICLAASVLGQEWSQHIPEWVRASLPIFPAVCLAHG